MFSFLTLPPTWSKVGGKVNFGADFSYSWRSFKGSRHPADQFVRTLETASSLTENMELSRGSALRVFPNRPSDCCLFSPPRARAKGRTE